MGSLLSGSWAEGGPGPGGAGLRRRNGREGSARERGRLRPAARPCRGAALSALDGHEQVKAVVAGRVRGADGGRAGGDRHDYREGEGGRSEVIQGRQGVPLLPQLVVG